MAARRAPRRSRRRSPHRAEPCSRCGRRGSSSPALAEDALATQYAVQSLEGFGIGAADAVAVGAAGALLRYLRKVQPGGLPHLARPIVERPGGTMPLDEMTRRNLELTESLRATGDTSGTLLGVLDRTQTPMGARALRQWILAPLTEVGAITARLDAVTSLFTDALARAALREALDGVRDVERLAGRAAASRATPRDVRALGDSLARLPEVIAALRRTGVGGTLAALAASWDDAPELAAEIARTLVARPPARVRRRRDNSARSGCDPRRPARRRDGREGCDRRALQAEERARTGITSLKVGYNRVFGYYIEITNANKDLSPADLPASPDADGRGALHPPGAEGVRGEGPARDGADGDARARSFSRRCARDWGRR